jgi:hypothetical protein
MRDSDIQNGRVIVNWWVTAGILFASSVFFGEIIANSLILGGVVGMFGIALWIAYELRAWESTQIDPDELDD